MSKIVTSYTHHQATGSPVVDGMRTDLNAGDRVCGCGEPAACVYYLATFRRKNGRTMRNTRRLPLCACHSAAHDVQARRRREAIARTWRATS